MPKPKPIVMPPRTIWEALEEDVIMNPPDPMDFTGVVYPKRPKTTKRVDPYDLPNLPTKVLMRYLDGARANGYGYNPFYYSHSGREIPIEEIKAELAKRPHVHNKQSGSEARRKSSQENHGPKPKKTKRPRTKKQKDEQKFWKNAALYKS